MALLATPFWESRQPRDWTDAELHQMLGDSPWAQTLSTVGASVQVFLASARPIQDAEAELRRRRRLPGDPDFDEFLQQDQGRHVVLAISYPDWNALSDAADWRRMEEECVLKVGKKKYKMTGSFPPGPSDPYLRLVYPREIGAGDKSFSFELYLPGVPQPFREAEFRTKDLLYHGRPEM
jgi:hypothetical protein